MTDTWGDLFERAAAFDADEAEIRERLESRREGGEDREGRDGSGSGDGAESGADGENEAGGDGAARRSPADDPPESSPARVVADADVLAADLLVGGDSRRALDALREHSWTALVAGDPLLDDAEGLVRAFADAELAADWRERVEAWRDPAPHPPGDHPALGAAYRGGAMHLLTLDPRLQTAQVGTTLRKRVELSVRHPRAFATLFDAEGLYAAVADGAYPGPDRDPRA